MLAPAIALEGHVTISAKRPASSPVFRDPKSLSTHPTLYLINLLLRVSRNSGWIVTFASRRSLQFVRVGPEMEQEESQCKRD
jgi:hypothetical protein